MNEQPWPTQINRYFLSRVWHLQSCFAFPINALPCLSLEFWKWSRWLPYCTLVKATHLHWIVEAILSSPWALWGQKLAVSCCPFEGNYIFLYPLESLHGSLEAEFLKKTPEQFLTLFAILITQCSLLKNQVFAPHSWKDFYLVGWAEVFNCFNSFLGDLPAKLKLHLGPKHPFHSPQVWRSGLLYYRFNKKNLIFIQALAGFVSFMWSRSLHKERKTPTKMHLSVFYKLHFRFSKGWIVLNKYKRKTWSDGNKLGGS